MSTDIKPGYYRHYKGKLHRVHFVGIHSETLEPLVCHESLYRNQKSRFWVRPAAMFSESVPLQDQPVLRFSRITDGEGRSAEQEFRRKNQPFKHNAVVYVRSGRYTGHGLVNFKDGYPERRPETQVPVLLENGNTWWYPAEYVEESTNRNQWPGWIRRRKRVKK
jgi:hypothetical protein